MTLKMQAQYDSAVALLASIGLTPAKFCVMTRALDLAEALEDTSEFKEGAGLDDVIASWAEFAEDDQASELAEAWNELNT